MQNLALDEVADRIPRWLFTFDEALSVLRVSRRTLQSYVSNKSIVVVRLGRRVFFRSEDLAAFIRSSLDGGTGK